MIISYKEKPIEVLDVYEDGAGIKWAAIKALEGQPFVGGNKWPVRTPYTTAKVKDLDMKCNCVLPEHSCPVCVKAARDTYSKNDEIPF